MIDFAGWWGYVCLPSSSHAFVEISLSSLSVVSMQITLDADAVCPDYQGIFRTGILTPAGERKTTAFVSVEPGFRGPPFIVAQIAAFSVSVVIQQRPFLIVHLGRPQIGLQKIDHTVTVRVGLR